jgi:hypothetical protein
VGKGRNEPAELARITRVLAELRGVSEVEIAVQATANSLAVLQLPPLEKGGWGGFVSVPTQESGIPLDPPFAKGEAPTSASPCPDSINPP